MSGFAGKKIDPRVVARAQAGDARAQEAIYRCFERPVYTLAARLTGSTVAADDLLQDTFVEVLRSLDRYRGDASLATWIRHVAVSKSLMYLRSAWQRKTTLYRDISEDGPAPDALSPDLALQLDLERALARLSDLNRVVVWLHDVEGYTHEEIAALTGNSVSYSKSRLARARLRLRKMLERPAPERAAAGPSGHRS